MSSVKNNKKSYMRDGKFTPEFDELAKERLERWHVPGMSIAVIEDDEVCAKVFKAHQLIPTLADFFRPMGSRGCLMIPSDQRRSSIVLA